MMTLKHSGLYCGIIVPSSRIVWKKNIRTTSTYCTNCMRNKIFMKSYVTPNSDIVCDIRMYSFLNGLNPVGYLRPMLTKSASIERNAYTYKSHTISISDKIVARLFVDIVKQDLLENGTFVIDPMPSQGYLARALLEAGLSKLYTFESTAHKYKALKLLENEYNNRLHCFDLPLVTVTSYLSGKPTCSFTSVKKVVDILPSGEWTAAPCMQVVGIAKTKFFMSQVLSATIFQSKLLSRGRVSFYIAISPQLWKTLSGETNNLRFYRHTSVLFQLFFDYKYLGAIHHPRFETRFTHKAYYHYYSKKEPRPGITVLKVEPKANLFNIVSREELVAFWFFLRSLMFRRTNRIIPMLECWVPGCGPLLIARNINMYTYVGDLSPQQLLDIFKQFSSWPEYQSSQFYENFEQIRGLSIARE